MKSFRMARLSASVRARKLLGNPPPQPEGRALRLLRPGLQDVERPEIDIGDAARERLARLAEEIDRGGAEHQEPAMPASGAPAFVDEAPQRHEQLGHPVYLVEDHQPVLVIAQEERRLGELGAVLGRFEVQVQRALPFAQVSGEGVFPTCRGPIRPTAVWRSRASWTSFQRHA